MNDELTPRRIVEYLDQYIMASRMPRNPWPLL